MKAIFKHIFLFSLFILNLFANHSPHLQLTSEAQLFDSNSSHTITTTADGVESVYATDVDGDGDIDVLSASYADDTIAWYENDGHENFTKHTITTTADGAESVYATDVDGDGDMDVLSASNNDDTIAWYENDGHENFTKHTITTTANGAYRVYAVDVDGDGDMDVLSASYDDDTIAWYENKSTYNVTENTLFVTDINATDSDANDTLTYSISGDDAKYFNIDANSGVLTFKTAPDFENPKDSNKDNIYELNVTVSDGNGGNDTRAIKVAVKDKYMDNVSSLSSTEDTIIKNSIELNVTVFDNDKNVRVALKPNDYKATIINGAKYATIENGVISALDTNYAGNIDVLYEYKDLKFIKSYTIYSFNATPANSLNSIKSSFSENPFVLTVGNTYQDELSDTNANENKTRWFKFRVKKSGIYKLFYIVNPDTLKQLSNTQITYNLYSGENRNYIGSKSFDANKDFYLDLALDGNTTYYLEFQTDEDLWKVDYKIGLLKHFNNENNGVYFKKFTLDIDGKSEGNKIVIPQFRNYTIELISTQGFYATLNNKAFSDNNSSYQSKEKKLKEDIYILSLHGEVNQEIYLKIDYAPTDVEFENNNKIAYSNIYNMMPTKANIDNSDIDFY